MFTNGPWNDEIEGKGEIGLLGADVAEKARWGTGQGWEVVPVDSQIGKLRPRIGYRFV